MVFGAYWGPRAETREGAAARIAEFLEAVARAQPRWSTWYVPMARERDPRIPFGVERESIAKRLQPVNRAMPQLGFSVAAWNEGVRFDAGVGLHLANPHLSNAATLIFDEDPRLTVDAWRSLVEIAVARFDPDRATVTTREAMAAHPGVVPWTLGWLTFERGGQLVEHLDRAPLALL